ncbi:hypothetical protein NC651_037843 [Populus alba x Populus x berolinensis]|nr:hypothetical protein NC651_037843 [Populus alba x Populus x berolinensis]
MALLLMVHVRFDVNVIIFCTKKRQKGFKLILLRISHGQSTHLSWKRQKQNQKESISNCCVVTAIQHNILLIPKSMSTVIVLDDDLRAFNALENKWRQ